MRGRGIAGIEAERIVRSPGTWLAALALLAVLAAGTALPVAIGLDAGADTGTALLLGPGVDIVLPILVIVFGYPALAGHRDRGTIMLFLATARSRGRVLAALFLARMVVLLGITVVALLGGVASILVLYGPPPLRPFVAFAALTVFAVICLTAVAVGVSASTRRPIRALAVLLAGFVIAYGLWEPAVEYGAAAITDAAPDDRPWFVRALILINPLESYGSAADGLLPASPHFSIEAGGEATTATRGELVGGAISARGLFDRLVVLGAWAFVVLAAGYARFRHAEFR